MESSRKQSMEWSFHTGCHRELSVHVTTECPQLWRGVVVLVSDGNMESDQGEITCQRSLSEGWLRLKLLLSVLKPIHGHPQIIRVC